MRTVGTLRGSRRFSTDLRVLSNCLRAQPSRSTTKVSIMREFLAPTLLFVGSHIVILYVAIQMYALGH